MPYFEERMKKKLYENVAYPLVLLCRHILEVAEKKKTQKTKANGTKAFSVADSLFCKLNQREVLVADY